jgi:nucleotide-binding universal stress UspA family protein
MYTTIRHILVPVHDGPESDDAVTLARTLAAAFGAAVHLVHVIEHPLVTPGPYQFHLPDTPERRERAYNAACARLRRVADMLRGHGVWATIEARSGVPADEIVEAAIDYGADLIVMATHGRSGLQHLLSGSVAEQVMRHARCPVVTVRAAAAAAAAWPPTARIA